MRFSSLDAWLAWQETLHPREIDLGLDRITQVAGRLGLLQPQARVITVAGTNGKGSCVATLDALLQAGGCTVGAYTSPHLLRYNERIRINGRCATDEAICRAFEAIDEAREDISLSYFEFGTLAAFWLFREYAVEYWLLEVGLGGRLDATNILDADIAIVTSIALDHQRWLGNDRQSIGREKAGIFRSGRPAICADENSPESVEARADDLGSLFCQAGRDFSWQPMPNAWHLKLKQEQAMELPLPQLPLPSVAAALQALALEKRLPPERDLIQRLPQLALSGRFQRLEWRGKTIYFDVAHNPAAAEYLAGRLVSLGGGKFAALAAIMADKDIPNTLYPLLPHVERWCLAGLPETPRAASPTQLEAELHQLEVPASAISSFATVKEAMEWLLTESDHDRLLVMGSFYTVSAALKVCEHRADS